MTTNVAFKTFHAIARLRRPRVALSACLAGHDVRYDGTHKAQQTLLQTLSDHVDYQTICPEVAAGMGVPRPPVQLQRKGDAIHVVAVTSQLDVTTSLQRGVATSVLQLQHYAPDAIVLKARSPSCGIGSTPLQNARNEPAGLSDGLFAAACRRVFPNALLCDEESLQTPQQCQRLAAAMLINIDLSLETMHPQPALLTHYARIGLDLPTSDAQATMQMLSIIKQLESWSELRMDAAFNTLFGRILQGP